MHELYVDKPEDLAQLCDRLRGNRWFALDTEFIREKTYYPILCLIQIADGERAVCIDPLVLTDLSPLFDILYDPGITKVLHSAQQDLEIFFNLRGSIPSPLFDTQIAATLLGQGDQIGYAALVKELLGVDLDKSQTRTDWSRRPLDAEQIRYALDDVRYLCQVYLKQHAALEDAQRLDWLADDFQALCDSANYRVQPLEAWQRIRGKQQLKGVQLAVLRALAAWREQQASTTNRPRKWVLSDEVLLELARRMPQDQKDLKPWRGFEPSLARRYGRILLELIAEARNEPYENWPTQPPRLQLSIEQEALVDALMAVIRLRGAEQAVSPQTLAGRKQLERLVVSGADIPLLHGWRATIAGREIEALLRGELRLEVREGELRMVPCD